MPQNILGVQQGEKDPYKITSAIRELVQRLGTMLATSSTDNALARYDGTAGSLQNSGVILDDSNNLTLPGLLTLTAGQIAFPATQNPSADANTLDDYEEGTWTPVLTFATPGDLNVVYSAQEGLYTKIGRLVTAVCTINTSTFTFTSASGNCNITGFPFANHATVRARSGTAQFQGVTKAGFTQMDLGMIGGQQLAIPAMSASATNVSAVTAANMPTGGTVIFSFTISYHT